MYSDLNLKTRIDKKKKKKYGLIAGDLKAGQIWQQIHAICASNAYIIEFRYKVPFCETHPRK